MCLRINGGIKARRMAPHIRYIINVNFCQGLFSPGNKMKFIECYGVMYLGENMYELLINETKK